MPHLVPRAYWMLIGAYNPMLRPRVFQAAMITHLDPTSPPPGILRYGYADPESETGVSPFQVPAAVSHRAPARSHRAPARGPGSGGGGGAATPAGAPFAPSSTPVGKGNRVCRRFEMTGCDEDRSQPKKKDCACYASRRRVGLLTLACACYASRRRVGLLTLARSSWLISSILHLLFLPAVNIVGDRVTMTGRRKVLAV